MKIIDKINVNDNSLTRNSSKEGVRGLIKIKDINTGEYLAIRESKYKTSENLVVNDGREHIRDLIKNATINTSINYIGYFKVGFVNTAETTLLATTATMTDLQNELELGQSYTFSETITADTVDYINPTSGNYTDDEYLLDDDGSTIIGKNYSDIQNVSTNSIMYKFRITPEDFTDQQKVNELGLFLISKDDSAVYTLPGDTGTEVMFSRVTFDSVTMDGSTEYIIEYYIYF